MAWKVGWTPSVIIVKILNLCLKGTFRDWRELIKWLGSWMDAMAWKVGWTHNNDKLRKAIIVGYQPKNIRQRRYEQKLNENEQYAGKRKSFPLSLPWSLVLIFNKMMRVLLLSTHLGQLSGSNSSNEPSVKHSKLKLVMSLSISKNWKIKNKTGSNRFLTMCSKLFFMCFSLWIVFIYKLPTLYRGEYFHLAEVWVGIIGVPREKPL